MTELGLGIEVSTDLPAKSIACPSTETGVQFAMALLESSEVQCLMEPKVQTRKTTLGSTPEMLFGLNTYPGQFGGSWAEYLEGHYSIQRLVQPSGAEITKTTDSKFPRSFVEVKCPTHPYQSLHYGCSEHRSHGLGRTWGVCPSNRVCINPKPPK